VGKHCSCHPTQLGQRDSPFAEAVAIHPGCRDYIVLTANLKGEALGQGASDTQVTCVWYPYHVSWLVSYEPWRLPATSGTPLHLSSQLQAHKRSTKLTGELAACRGHSYAGSRLSSTLSCLNMISRGLKARPILYVKGLPLACSLSAL
jgi:hypothetical protein